MEVKIKKLCDSAVIPSYAKSGDAGMDLVATSRIFDKYGNVEYGTGLAMEIPEGYFGKLTIYDSQDVEDKTVFYVKYGEKESSDEEISYLPTRVTVDGESLGLRVEYYDNLGNSTGKNIVTIYGTGAKLSADPDFEGQEGLKFTFSKLTGEPDYIGKLDVQDKNGKTVTFYVKYLQENESDPSADVSSGEEESSLEQ